MIETLALNENWLDTNTGSAQGIQQANQHNCLGGNWGGWGGYGYYYPVYYSTPARPIKLALSEIEHLRKAARSDKKLKEILSKFTSLIEVTVDFE